MAGVCLRCMSSQVLEFRSSGKAQRTPRQLNSRSASEDVASRTAVSSARRLGCLLKAYRCTKLSRNVPSYLSAAALTFITVSSPVLAGVCWRCMSSQVLEFRSSGKAKRTPRQLNSRSASEDVASRTAASSARRLGCLLKAYRCTKLSRNVPSYLSAAALTFITVSSPVLAGVCLRCMSSQVLEFRSSGKAQRTPRQLNSRSASEDVASRTVASSARRLGCLLKAYRCTKLSRNVPSYLSAAALTFITVSSPVLAGVCLRCMSSQVLEFRSSGKAQRTPRQLNSRSASEDVASRTAASSASRLLCLLKASLKAYRCTKLSRNVPSYLSAAALTFITVSSPVLAGVCLRCMSSQVLQDEACTDFKLGEQPMLPWQVTPRDSYSRLLLCRPLRRRT